VRERGFEPTNSSETGTLNQINCGFLWLILPGIYQIGTAFLKSSSTGSWRYSLLILSGQFPEQGRLCIMTQKGSPKPVNRYPKSLGTIGTYPPR